MLAATLVAVIATVGAPAYAARPFQPTCKSGRTLFRQGDIRAFWVSFNDIQVQGDHQELLACLHRRGRPVVLYDPGPFNYVQGERFHLIHNRLGFVVHDQGFDNGSETDVGWVALHTADVRIGLLNAGENGSASDPQLPEDSIAYAIAPDGGMAVIAGSDCQVVASLKLLAKPIGGFYGLSNPIVLFGAPGGGLNSSSIAIDFTTVWWRTTSGVSGSAPRSGLPRSQIASC